MVDHNYNGYHGVGIHCIAIFYGVLHHFGIVYREEIWARIWL